MVFCPSREIIAFALPDPAYSACNIDLLSWVIGLEIGLMHYLLWNEAGWEY